MPTNVEEKWKADRDFPHRVRPRTTPETDGKSPTPLPLPTLISTSGEGCA